MGNRSVFPIGISYKRALIDPDAQNPCVQVTVHVDENDSQAHIGGSRADGNRFSFWLPRSSGYEGGRGDPLVGQCVDGWWIRAPADAESTAYVLAQGRGALRWRW